MASSASTLTEAEYREFRRRAVDRIAEALVVDPPGDGDVRRAIPQYVREWVDEHYEAELGTYDPEVVEAAVPTDPDAVESSATTPLSEEGGDEARRRELYARRAVRADLTVALRDDADRLERAIAVHDALEELVGERGSGGGRRPSALVEAFADWVAAHRDEGTGERAREAFTPLHVMRIAGLDVVGEGPSELGLLRGLEEWLRDAEPQAFDSAGSTSE